MESGVLVDRTILAPNTPAPNFTTKTICSNVTSLGPFVIAQSVDQSLRIIDGLIVDTNGQPLSDIDVTLSGGRAMTTQTDFNGRFRFTNLAAGASYTVTPSAASFAFAPLNKSFANLQADQAETFVASVVPPPGVAVSGRVLTSDGRGLRNATVSITDSNGAVRTATTSSFGLYSFDNVAPFGSYTLRVSSRLYRFAPQTVLVTDNLTLPDFVGLE